MGRSPKAQNSRWTRAFPANPDGLGGNTRCLMKKGIQSGPEVRKKRASSNAKPAAHQISGQGKKYGRPVLEQKQRVGNKAGIS